MEDITMHNVFDKQKFTSLQRQEQAIIHQHLEAVHFWIFSN